MNTSLGSKLTRPTRKGFRRLALVGFVIGLTIATDSPSLWFTDKSFLWVFPLEMQEGFWGLKAFVKGYVVLIGAIVILIFVTLLDLLDYLNRKLQEKV